VVQPQRLGENLADSHARIERGIGILENELRIPSQRRELTLFENCDISAVEAYSPARRINQPQHQPAERCLTASGLANERERRAGIERKAHRINCGDGCGRTSEG